MMIKQEKNGLNGWFIEKMENGIIQWYRLIISNLKTNKKSITMIILEKRGAVWNIFNHLNFQRNCPIRWNYKNDVWSIITQWINW